ncbi:protein TIFY 5A [Manihot esculenta]|uniref:Protein TIFY n=1 Tax=Manihot esculenta TaxID=3983 RepID=A0A2C9UF73_MANES|nr:protein TIFY 5A [Manihot esculenta]OAY29166.1 hypothetical protein MANES_15G122900v8 [Manihot esculenta]
MRRNCNLELRLFPFSDPDYHPPILEKESKNEQSPQQNQQLTIFYNGTVCACDVTELQARAILFLASREMEEKQRTPTPTPTPTPSGSEVASPNLPSQLCSPIAAGLSMKRSIQRFLQKRKHRVQENSPYNH